MTFIPVKKIDDREERRIMNADSIRDVMVTINGIASLDYGYNMAKGVDFKALIVDVVGRANMYSVETDKFFKLAGLMKVAMDTLEDEFEIVNPVFELKQEWFK